MSQQSAKKKSAGKIPSLISDAKLKQLYATMLKCRILDSHAGPARGRSWKGKEAAAVGAAIDLRPEDTIVYSSDAAVANFLKGVPLRSILHQPGKESSSRVQKKASASHTTQAKSAVATGIAYAQSSEGKENVTVAFLSNNPAESAAERDALLFAGAQKLPIIYVYSGEPVVGMPERSYGFPSILVDGSDVVAVYRVAHECTTRAREGGGPSVIACSFASTNGSSPSSRDPLRNMEKYLSAKGLFSSKQKQSTIQAFEKAIAAARKQQRHGKTKPASSRVFAV